MLGQIPIIGPFLQTAGTLAYLAYLFASGVGAGIAAAQSATTFAGAASQFVKALFPFLKALLGLYVQAFIDGMVGVVIESVKSEIREHGFWNGIFRGIGKGFRYLGQSLFGRGLFWSVTFIYGFYCGGNYGTDGLQAGETPIDDFDAACRTHDLEMERIKRDISDPEERAKAKIKADLAFIRQVLFSRSRNPRAGAARPWSIIIFLVRSTALRITRRA